MHGPSRLPLTRDITYWGEASMRARAVPEGRPVRCGELKKGIFDPGLGTKKGGLKTSLFRTQSRGRTGTGCPTGV